MVVLCDDLLRLTRSYLDYAGLVQGTRPLCLGAFTVGALIREIDRQFAEAAAARRIAWECALDGPDATVTTDASRCQQIFGNLVVERPEVHARGGRGPRLRPGRRASRWVVTVADNGPGHPGRARRPGLRAVLPAGPRRAPRVDGNGLGLAICREMVGQLGGEIALHSKLGQGTRVTVRFPVDAPGRPTPRHAG